MKYLWIILTMWTAYYGRIDICLADDNCERYVPLFYLGISLLQKVLNCMDFQNVCVFKMKINIKVKSEMRYLKKKSFYIHVDLYWFFYVSTIKI